MSRNEYDLWTDIEEFHRWNTKVKNIKPIKLEEMLMWINSLDRLPALRKIEYEPKTSQAREEKKESTEKKKND